MLQASSLSSLDAKMELCSLTKVLHLFLKFIAILESTVVLKSVLEPWSLNVLCEMWRV